MDNKNLFTEWVDAKNNAWFTTRSPYPDMPCYIAPYELPKCSNYSSYFRKGVSKDEVLTYLVEQVRILRFNNPDFSSEQVTIAVKGRLIYWLGNNTLKNNPALLDELLPVAVYSVYSDDSFTDKLKNVEYTKYWYSDEIVKLSGKGRAISDRFKAKQKARNELLAEGYRDDIKDASNEYRTVNFSVHPTMKDINGMTGYSNPTIRKYGKGQYILKGENLSKRISKVREMYPEITQREVSELLGEKVRTIRQYWKS